MVGKYVARCFLKKKRCCTLGPSAHSDGMPNILRMHIENQACNRTLSACIPGFPIPPPNGVNCLNTKLQALLSLNKLEVLEVNLLFGTAHVGDAELGGLHTAEFVARVDDGIVVSIVEQAYFLPSTISE